MELLTNSYSDRQASPQNQATNDEQARKYKEEYAKYEHELQQQQAEYGFYLEFIDLIFLYLVTEKNIQMQQHQLMNNN